MAGHSKWNNIKRRKEAQDSKRAKVFTKITKEIFASVRAGGDDPATNLRLRLAIQKGKEANLPSDNIERTIKKKLQEIKMALRMKKLRTKVMDQEEQQSSLTC